MTEDLRARDAQARALALDPERSFIVQAPAGSGKTELLTQRYLVLLARVEHPEEIVAITFTNKAAGEMRARLLAALRAAPGEPPAAAHKRLTWELARRALARDAERGWRLTDNPRRLRVRTIDALCAALARRRPLTAGFGAPPSVLEDARELYLEAARNTIALLESGERWSVPVERLLRHLDNDLAAIEELIAGMLARRDQWLRHLAGGAGDARLARPVLEAALANVIHDALADLAAAVPPAEADELVALASHAGTNLAHAAAASELIACAGLAALPGKALADLAAWRGIAQLLLTQDGQWRSRIDKGIGFPGDGANAAHKAGQKAMKERAASLIGRCARNEPLRVRLHALRSLPSPAYDEGQWSVLAALAEVLPLAAAQLTLVFRARGKVDFAAVAHGALEALGSEGAPSELALALDYRIRHILVDEFQDTSLSQYELLARLTAGWAPGDGRTLFTVGDPMQSIYRFREAEVGLYLRARREGIGDMVLEPLTLAVNFRSQQGVVDWVNAAFAKVLPAVEDMSFGAVPHVEAIAHHPPAEGAAVTVHPFFAHEAAAEARQVVSQVQAARTRNPGGSIAILVRARGHLDEIIPALREAAIPFTALDIEPLGHRPVVQDLLALTRALMHPADRIAWFAVLRAPWCGLTLADLEALVAAQPAAALCDLIEDESGRARLSGAAQARVARVAGVLAAARRHRQRRGLRRTVEGVWVALGGPACVSAADLEDADEFLSLVEELEEGGALTDTSVLPGRLGNLYARAQAVSGGNVVQIMTVHKAKGLEFDSVIVPGLGRAPRSTEKQLLLWAERARTHAAADLLLAPVRATGGDEDPIYRYLRRLDAERGRYEDGRLLYVAATRARQCLHLLGHTTLDEDGELRDPAATSLLKSLWPAVAEDFARALPPAQAPRAVASGVRAEQEFHRLPVDWRPPAVPPAVTESPSAPPAVAEQAIEFEWVGEVARHVGTVVHRYLLRIAREGAARWSETRIEEQAPAITRALGELGVPGDELGAAAARVTQALGGALADPRGRWLLDSRHRDARAEYALSGELEGRIVNVILDRTFVDEQGVRWIVDYKTSSHAGAGLDEFLDREVGRYREQLERYARLFSGFGGRGPVRLGLYFPLLQGWREWPAPG
jgi:ATP-dependent exoDNAse (exonuclease V) beta subunit